MNSSVFWFIHISILILFCSAIYLFYRKFPLHLIYKSKIGLQEMLDGISDPLAVISDDYTVKRANKAYISLVGRDFPNTIGIHCYELLRGIDHPCPDCAMKKARITQTTAHVERSTHPDGKGSISITFSPFIQTLETESSFTIEHIHDITILEKLKLDLESKNKTLAHTTKTLKAAQQNIRDELRLARLIQQGLLPKNAPDIPGLKISNVYHPITDVGGDLYDFIQFSPKRFGVFIGDASGHGLSAAFVGTISKMSLYNHSQRELPVNKLLASINHDLLTNIHTGHYLTCFFCIFDLENCTITFSRAGHPVPVLIKKDGTVIPLKTNGTFLGLVSDIPFESVTIDFEKGDRFYFFTDGIYEVMQSPDKNDALFGYDRFVELLTRCSSQPFSKLITGIQHELKNYTYEDDYTLIAIESTISSKNSGKTAL
ncbi:MAG: SpoIIE family protein phosphatase [Fibrobacter sp.]|nr:SpoIIE family protein phosphatase [Fibrobacter sp.]